MIEFLQVVESLLFLVSAYQVIKLSPLFEKAAFINGQSLERKEFEAVVPVQTIEMNKVVRNFKLNSNHHYTGMTLAH